MKRKCDGAHEHQPLVEGRAKDAARYPLGLRRAICRGVAKEDMQREHRVRAVSEIGKGLYKRVIDSEDHHDRMESKLGRYLTAPGRSTPPVPERGIRESGEVPR
ncbi:hypothetical protein N9L68_09330 [bacterium]|nr:hypothetical protein [bacterium]